VRRSFCALLLLGCVGVAPLAFAQDVQPDAGAIATASATTPPPPPPPPAPPPQPTTSTVSDLEPLQLGRLIELEADRARARRYGSFAFGTVLGGAEIVTGALLFTVPSSGTDATIFDILGVTSMVVGGLSVIEELISLFVSSPMERLFDQYAPIAIDKTLPASERVHRGEQMLEAMANAEHGARTLNGATALVTAAVFAGLAIFVGADNDLWVCDPSTTDCSAVTLDRVIISTAFAVGAVTSIGDGLAKLFWERGPAEVAWEHWHASHEQVTVQTARVHFTPVLAPIRGGATAGFSLRF
jgi:hypothetical protein